MSLDEEFNEIIKINDKVFYNREITIGSDKALLIGRRAK
jgi:galactitol-specific phosphotransferase system IIC component